MRLCDIKSYFKWIIYIYIQKFKKIKYLIFSSSPLLPFCPCMFFWKACHGKLVASDVKHTLDGGVKNFITGLRMCLVFRWRRSNELIQLKKSKCIVYLLFGFAFAKRFQWDFEISSWFFRSSRDLLLHFMTVIINNFYYFQQQDFL